MMRSLETGENQGEDKKMTTFRGRIAEIMYIPVQCYATINLRWNVVLLQRGAAPAKTYRWNRRARCVVQEYMTMLVLVSIYFYCLLYQNTHNRLLSPSLQHIYTDYLQRPSRTDGTSLLLPHQNIHSYISLYSNHHICRGLYKDIWLSDWGLFCIFRTASFGAVSCPPPYPFSAEFPLLNYHIQQMF